MRLLNRLTFTGGPFRLLPFMEPMELNDPITISNEYHFCEVGNRLALVFLNASRDAVAMVYTEVRDGCPVACRYCALCVALTCCKLSRLQ